MKSMQGRKPIFPLAILERLNAQYLTVTLTDPAL